jgi:hypothetical protein
MPNPNVMPQQNKIILKPEDLKKAIDGLVATNAVLKPYLTALTPVERQELPRMSDDASPFVQKALEYAQINTDFMPTYINIKALKTDLEAVEALAQIFRYVEQLYFKLSDTMTLSGSEAYVASLAFYNSVRHAEKMNVPGAKAIAEDLRRRLPGYGKKTVNDIKIIKWIKAVSGKCHVYKYLNIIL